jgi:hypothetical protein
VAAHFTAHSASSRTARVSGDSPHGALVIKF